MKSTVVMALALVFTLSCARAMQPSPVTMAPLSYATGGTEYGPLPPELYVPDKPPASYTPVKPSGARIVIDLARLDKNVDAPKVTIKIGGAPIGAALEFLGEAAGRNILADPSIKDIPATDITLTEVSWIDALAAIAKANGLAATVNGERLLGAELDVGSGDVIIVMTPEKFLENRETAKKAAGVAVEIAERTRKAEEEKQALKKTASEIVTRSYRFKYADPSEAVEYLEQLFTDYEKEYHKQHDQSESAHLEGAVNAKKLSGDLEKEQQKSDVSRVRKPSTSDARFALYKAENMITVTAPAKIMEDIFDRIKEIDVKPKQIYIEARIVEVQRNYLKDLGIQWGGHSTGVTGYTFPNSIGVYGAGNDGSGGVEGTAISLPPLSAIDSSTGAVLSNPAGASVGVSVGSVSGSLVIQAKLFAMEKAGVSKTLSNPKVVTINGMKATIKSGREVPYQASSANSGVSIQFKEAVISLGVTPLIMDNGKIRMKIAAKKDEVDQQLMVQGTPSIRKKELSTSVVVDDGGSAVLGGILEEENIGNQSRIPGVHDIPILGWLFKNDRKSDNAMELLVFITPTIVDQGRAP